jgi:hypothetical protein
MRLLRRVKEEKSAGGRLADRRNSLCKKELRRAWRGARVGSLISHEKRPNVQPKVEGTTPMLGEQTGTSPYWPSLSSYVRIVVRWLFLQPSPSPSFQQAHYANRDRAEDCETSQKKTAQE